MSRKFPTLSDWGHEDRAIVRVVITMTAGEKKRYLELCRLKGRIPFSQCVRQALEEKIARDFPHEHKG